MLANDRILAVDDNADNLLVLTELLERDFQVRCVESGEDALRVATEFRPNLILLDLMMPGLDGHETCRRLRRCAELRDTKIVMLSAKLDLPDRLISYDCGAEDYITKPFNGDEVVAKIAAWMRMVRKDRIDDMWREIDEAHTVAGAAVSLVADFRETETGEHLYRVRWYSQATAEQLASASTFTGEIDEGFLQSLYRATPLHDIGKVRIDPRILRKQGPLTACELAAVRQHVIYGADLLESAASRDPASPYLAMAAEIARRHHERFDGTGYPDGLQGDEIPLAARIFAVADVFDALTTETSYKPAMSVEHAFTIIADKSGSWFDPEVVDAFLMRADDIRAAQGGLNAEPSPRENQLVGARDDAPLLRLDSDYAEYAELFAALS